MKNINKFTCRGITKETGKFCYGYYFYDEYKNKHIIKYQQSSYVPSSAPSLPDDLVKINYEIEIIQEPDRFIGNFDGVDYFENDKLKIQNEDFLDENGDFNEDEYFEEVILKRDGTVDFDSEITLLWWLIQEGFNLVKKIGNTHGIKEEL